MSPIGSQEGIKGFLVGELLHTQRMIERYDALSKVRVNFFVGNQLMLGTLRTQKTLPLTHPQKLTCEDLLNQKTTIRLGVSKIEGLDYYQGQCTFKAVQDPAITIVANLSQPVEKQGVRKMMTAVLTISGIGLIVAFGLSVFFSRREIRSVHNLVYMIGLAAEGDLRQTAATTIHDEIGLLALKLNQMILQLRGISGQVQAAAYAVNGTADSILKQMESLIHHMEQQSASVDNTTGSIETIKEFIDVVAQNTNDLLAAAAQILSSAQETRASIEEVTTSTGSLTTNLHLISAAIDQVNQAVKQISEHTGQMEKVAQHTETEIHHIDQSLREVSLNADQTQELAKETMEAAMSGQTSVEASLPNKHHY
jgi:methyl-accepting chemotaxis protein